MIALPPLRRFLNDLIPPRSPSVILKVVVDFGLFASGSEVSASSSQVATGVGAQPCSSAPPCSSSPPSPLPEHSESLAVAAPSLDSISKDTESSPSHLPASQALVPVGLAVGGCIGVCSPCWS